MSKILSRQKFTCDEFKEVLKLSKSKNPEDISYMNVIMFENEFRQYQIVKSLVKDEIHIECTTEQLIYSEEDKELRLSVYKNVTFIFSDKRVLVSHGDRVISSKPGKGPLTDYSSNINSLIHLIKHPNHYSNEGGWPHGKDFEDAKTAMVKEVIKERNLDWLYNYSTIDVNFKDYYENKLFNERKLLNFWSGVNNFEVSKQLYAERDSYSNIRTLFSPKFKGTYTNGVNINWDVIRNYLHEDFKDCLKYAKVFNKPINLAWSQKKLDAYREEYDGKYKRFYLQRKEKERKIYPIHKDILEKKDIMAEQGIMLMSDSIELLSESLRQKNCVFNSYRDSVEQGRIMIVRYKNATAEINLRNNDLKVDQIRGYRNNEVFYTIKTELQYKLHQIFAEAIAVVQNDKTGTAKLPFLYQNNKATINDWGVETAVAGEVGTTPAYGTVVNGEIGIIQTATNTVTLTLRNVVTNTLTPLENFVEEGPVDEMDGDMDEPMEMADDQDFDNNVGIILEAETDATDEAPAVGYDEYREDERRVAAYREDFAAEFGEEATVEVERLAQDHADMMEEGLEDNQELELEEPPLTEAERQTLILQRLNGCMVQTLQNMAGEVFNEQVFKDAVEAEIRDLRFNGILFDNDPLNLAINIQCPNGFLPEGAINRATPEELADFQDYIREGIQEAREEAREARMNEENRLTPMNEGEVAQNLQDFLDAM